MAQRVEERFFVERFMRRISDIAMELRKASGKLAAVVTGDLGDVLQYRFIFFIIHRRLDDRRRLIGGRRRRLA